MAKVDIKDVEKKVFEEEKKKRSLITVRRYGTKNYYSGPGKDEWYESNGEALEAHQRHKTLEGYKAAGLDEHGRSPEDVERGEKISALITARAKLFDKIREIDQEIGSVRSGRTEEKEEPTHRRRGRKR